MDYNLKVLCVCVTIFIWIFYRKLHHYIYIPRRNFNKAVAGSIYMFFVFHEPLLLPIGFIGLFLYGEYQHKKYPEKKINL